VKKTQPRRQRYRHHQGLRAGRQSPRVPRLRLRERVPRHEIRSGLTLSINANNVFNTFGLSEAEENAIPANGIVRARGITGRTVSTTLRYSF
jgi:outer membrane receptor protein involved in Fe transport